MTEFRQEFRISVRGLELGMFVSRLDRPWLETPFLMQGFQVTTDEELQKLQRMCSHVYVDIELGKSPDPRFIELDTTDLVEAAHGRDEFIDLRKTQWEVKTDFKTELGHAAIAHDVLQRGIEEVMEDLKNGRELDLDKLRHGVDAMIDSITRRSAFIRANGSRSGSRQGRRINLGVSIIVPHRPALLRAEDARSKLRARPRTFIQPRYIGRYFRLVRPPRSCAGR